MSAEQLAIHGGPPTLRSSLPYRWHQVRRGVTRSFDLMKMLPLTLRGVTSIQDASGIVGRFEHAFCHLTGARHALAMNSGTATLHSAYFALGVGPGTEVVVPAYTWHASATPVLQCSAVPVFCEIDPRTLTIDVDDLERRLTERTRAICVVHTWGNPAPMDRIMDLANRRGIAVVEDCSHAHGASYKGKAVGTWGQVGCYSLQGSKTVEGGEAGIALTDDPVLYDRMCLLGHNVLVKKGQRAHTFPFGDVSLGVKYRPHPAAMYLAHAALMRLRKRNQRAERVWHWLCEEFRDVPAIRAVETPPGGVRGGWYAFVFEYRGAELGGPGTEEFVAAVKAEGVPIDFDQFRGSSLHTLPLFTELDRRELGGGCWDPTRPWEENLTKVSLPVTEQVLERLFRLPPWLYDVPESYVRGCGRAVKKVLSALLPGDARAAVHTAPEAAPERAPLASSGA